MLCLPVEERCFRDWQTGRGSILHPMPRRWI
jgi:hypothetical protein